MLTLYVFSITFSGKSHNGLQQTIPALFIKISTPPNSSFRFLAASKTFSRFEISTTYPLHEIPSAWSSSTVLFIARIDDQKKTHLIRLKYQTNIAIIHQESWNKWAKCAILCKFMHKTCSVFVWRGCFVTVLNWR